jgi:hypothetical protein
VIYQDVIKGLQLIEFCASLSRPNWGHEENKYFAAENVPDEHNMSQSDIFGLWHWQKFKVYKWNEPEFNNYLILRLVLVKPKYNHGYYVTCIIRATLSIQSVCFSTIRYTHNIFDDIIVRNSSNFYIVICTESSYACHSIS